MSVPSTIKIGPPSPTATSHLSDALAEAFRRNPFHRWVFPDRHWARASAASFRAAVLLRQGTTRADAGSNGAALWDGPVRRGLRRRLAYDLQMVRLLRGRTWVVARATRRMAQLRPKTPHWYLAILGVRPTMQGLGIGSALLVDGLREADRDGLEVWCETSDSGNLAFYQRHGFEIQARVRVSGGPLVWSLRRAPRRPVRA